MVILELQGLTKQFGELVAVDNVDMSIEEGEIRGLIGPNGSGKTTIFNCITGFLRPTGGKVIWQGEDITGRPPHVVAGKGMARTFQLTNLFRDLTALQNVVMAFHLHTGVGLLGQFLMTKRTKKRDKEIEERAIEILETMGIGDVKDEIAGSLPHGHQEALGVAMALATEPRILLLDEPVTSMNPSETKDMMERITRLRDSGVTVLLVEHDMRAVMSTCEKITVVNFGKKICEGDPGGVCSHEEVVEAYLGRS
jgi:branched-chain amino acid transport system ATP-binding protein